MKSFGTLHSSISLDSNSAQLFQHLEYNRRHVVFVESSVRPTLDLYVAIVAFFFKTSTFPLNLIVLFLIRFVLISFHFLPVSIIFIRINPMSRHEQLLTLWSMPFNNTWPTWIKSVNQWPIGRRWHCDSPITLNKKPSDRHYRKNPKHLSTLTDFSIDWLKSFKWVTMTFDRHHQQQLLRISK